MFDDEVYEVTRDEFKGFIDQIKPSCFEYQTRHTCNEDTYNVDFHEVKVVSKDGRIFAKVTSTPEDVHYYVYEMPHNDERQPPKVVRHITLGSPEDVAEFFKILKQVQEKKDD